MNARTKTRRRPQVETLEDRRLLSGPGSLDPGFGSGGIVATTDHPTTVFVRQDGKILTAGWTSVRSGSKVSLARYDSAGRPDTSFGSGGKVISSALGAAEKAAMYPDAGTAHDGKIVAMDGSFKLARYNPNGSLDTSFGKKGVATTTFPEGTWWPASRDILVQPDGKIITSGWISDPSGTGLYHIVFALARHNTNGSLDTSFGSEGFARPIAGPGDSWINDIELQPDGRIVVAAAVGLIPEGTPSDTSFAVARLNANGSLDTSFGPDGTGVAAVSGGGEAYGVAIQPDGKIVAAGRKGRETLDRYEWMLARFDPNGILDPSFDADGVVIPPIEPDSWANDVALQADGAIVAGGFVGTGSNAGLVRYDASGQLDPTFGNGGIVLSSLSGAGHSSVTIQPDGNILTIGRSQGNSTTSQYLARYLGTATVTVGTPSLATTSSDSTRMMSGVAILDDAALNIWPGGTFSSNHTARRRPPKMLLGS